MIIVLTPVVYNDLRLLLIEKQPAIQTLTRNVPLKLFWGTEQLG